MIAKMHERAAKIRQRAAIRRWEYRQRNHARGVWFRLRRVLAEAEDAYAIDDADTATLLQRLLSEPVGAELEPRKTLIFIERSQLAALPSARAVPIRMGDILAASNVALVRFATR